MPRAFALSLPLALAGLPIAVALPSPAPAQTAKLDCAAKPKKRSKGLGMFGRIAGDMAGDLLGTRTPSLRFGGRTLYSFSLTRTISDLLDEAEQKQAACATEQVVERADKGEVGATEAWTSRSRREVSGSSTVVAANTLPDGTRCMNVTDVVIVEGEETRVSKRMCRAPGQSRYTVAQV